LDFLHTPMYLEKGSLVQLSCDTQCNFMLMDDANFASYQSGSGFRYLGGLVRRSPATIRAPHSGYWNVVIDVGGGSASIRYGLRVLEGA